MLLKTARVSATNTDTSLTQPTELAAGGLMILYQPLLFAPWWDSIGAFSFPGREANGSPQEATMLTSETIERSKAVEGLAAISREWEDAADGKPLELVYGSVGLLLDDVCHALRY